MPARCYCGESCSTHTRTVRSSLGELRIGRCRACRQIRDVRDYDLSYYKDDAGIYKPPSEKKYTDRMNAYRRYVPRILKYGPRQGRILEVGCNAGFFLENMKREGWQALGIDLNPSVVDFARARGLDVRCGTLDNLATEEDGSFDWVVLIHCFEHLPDIPDAVRRIASLLKSGGHCLIAVPNYGAVFHNLWYRERTDFFVPGQHLWYFEPHTLEQCFLRFGFQKAEIATFTGLSAESKITLPFVRQIKTLLAAFLLRMDWGDELIGVFRKP